MLEQDANLLLDFVDRTQQVSDVKKMMREFCLFMLEKQHLQWKPALRSAFIKIWSKLAQEEYVEVRMRSSKMLMINQKISSFGQVLWFRRLMYEFDLCSVDCLGCP